MNRSTPAHTLSRKVVLETRQAAALATKQAAGLGPNPKNMPKADRKEKYTKLAHERTKAKARKRSHKDTVCFVCREKVSEKIVLLVSTSQYQPELQIWVRVFVATD